MAMIHKQRASRSQPNLLKYTTQSADTAVHAALSSLRLHEGVHRSTFPLECGLDSTINTAASSPIARSPHRLFRQFTFSQTLQQSAALPNHGRLHRQLTPHMSRAQPGSPSTATNSTASHLKQSPARPITRHRSFQLGSAGPMPGTHASSVCDVAGSVSSCSGLSSELTNAIEHQSASVRSSTDSRRSNLGGMRRSCSHPNSLDMSRSSMEGPRDNIEPSPGGSLCSAISSHRSSPMAACPAPMMDTCNPSDPTADRHSGAPRSSTEAAEASSKLCKSSRSHYTHAVQCCPDPTQSLPSCAMSASASEDCLARVSEGSSMKSLGTPHAMPVPNMLPSKPDGAPHDDKRSNPLLSVQIDAVNGVRKSRDPHSHGPTPRRSCGSFDVARQVQQYTSGAAAAALAGPRAAAHGSAHDPTFQTNNPPCSSPQSKAAMHLHSHKLAMSSLFFQPSATAATEPASPRAPPAARAVPQTIAQRRDATMSTTHALNADNLRAAGAPADVRRSDVSEGACSTSTAVFGSPVPVPDGFLHGTQVADAAAKPAVVDPKAHKMVFSSALFQQAPGVPTYPSTQRGGIQQHSACPPRTHYSTACRGAEDAGRSLVHGSVPAPRWRPASSPRSSDPGFDADGCGTPHCLAESPAALATPRTSSDPVSRPSTDTAFELDLEMRVARSRQTMDFAARQRIRFGSLSRARLTIMEGLELMESLPRSTGQEAAPLSATSYSLLCAQWCVHEFPGHDWAPLVGLMHDLGRLLLHPKFGPEPAWAVTSESYPLGCRFSESISGYFFLHACPDRRCSAYAKPTGIYSAHCGLDATHFTWTAAEYLSLVVSQNGGCLPFPATFLLRYQNFESAIEDGAYSLLMSDDDVQCLPLLRKFSAVRRAALAGAGPPRACSHTEVIAKCEAAIKQYFPHPQLSF